MRIVQLANFIHESSGGIRTMLDALSGRYVAAGHEVLLIRPGHRHRLVADADCPGRSVMTLPGVRMPASGGYRLLVRRGPLASVLAAWRPDVVEVSDKTTLGWVGGAAHELGAASVLVSHERLDFVLGDHLGAAAGMMRRAACWHQRRLLAGYDLVVCCSRYAAEEVEPLGGPPVAVVPLGVDLQLFHPDRRHELAGGPLARAEPHDAGRGRWRRPRLVMVSRLTREKQPSVALAATRQLLREGIDAELFIAGDGPLRRAMSEAAGALGATMLGHLRDRQLLAALIADADAVISPGRRETFGLAALEALASGTPIVAVDQGALPELVVPGAGVTRSLDGVSFADGVRTLLAGDRDAQRAIARASAERFTWERSAAELLDRYADLRSRRHDALRRVA